MKNRIYLAAALCGLLAAASCTKDNGVGIMTKEDYEGAVENGIPTYADDYSPIANWDFHPNWNLANVHDPSVAYYDGYYYMFGTSASYGNEHDKATIGRQYQGKRSKDLVNWTHVYGPMSTAPAWVKDSLNSIRGRMDLPAIENPVYGYWAPVIRVVDGKLRMYYSIVVDNCIKTGGTGFDGSWTERAFIGMAETTDPSNPEAWEDKGFVVCSSTAKAAGDWGRASAGGDYGNAYFYYNAIDPTYIVAPDGKHWLIYGSWHSGFALLEINPATGKPVNTLGNPWANGDVADLQSRYGVRIATRVPTGTWSHWQGSEAPEIIFNNGYYYLFMAYDGLDIPYNTRVARSSKIEGPYVDIKGTDITAGGVAYPIVTHPYKFSQGDGWVGISHCGIPHRLVPFLRRQPQRPVADRSSGALCGPGQHQSDLRRDRRHLGAHQPHVPAGRDGHRPDADARRRRPDERRAHRHLDLRRELPVSDACARRRPESGRGRRPRGRLGSRTPQGDPRVRRHGEVPGRHLVGKEGQLTFFPGGLVCSS